MAHWCPWGGPSRDSVLTFVADRLHSRAVVSRSALVSRSQYCQVHPSSSSLSLWPFLSCARYASSEIADDKEWLTSTGRVILSAWLFCSSPVRMPFEWALKWDTKSWHLVLSPKCPLTCPCPRTSWQSFSSFTPFSSGHPRTPHILTLGHNVGDQIHCSLFFPLGRLSSAVFQGHPRIWL